MNTTEHIEKIKAKCEARITTELTRPTLLQDKTAIAGWRSTIAAIEGLQKLALATELYPGHGGSPEVLYHLNSIIATWPEELL